MPAPTWDWAPQRDNGNYEAGFDRDLRPSEQTGWSPSPALSYPYVPTEPGGAMLGSKGMMRSGHGIGDMFTFPQQSSAQSFYDQQIASGAMPHPQVIPDNMAESALFGPAPRGHKVGSMAWESGPAPWEMPGAGGGVLAPGQADQAIARMQDRQASQADRKALEASQAAKIAADNAVRAAVAGAPMVASTNAATAQAAANVAAGVARSRRAQQSAALAQSEATKAVAAANVAANNARGMGDYIPGEIMGVSRGSRAFGMPARPRQGPVAGLGDFMNVSGMGGFFDTPIAGGFQVKHGLIGLAVAVGGYALGRKLWPKN